jgi:transposase-like protein
VHAKPACVRCPCDKVVRNGHSHGLQRYKCRGCGITFNALSGTPLARLRQKSKWLQQAQALCEGLVVREVAEQLQVAASTAFRWRHRVLKLAQQAKVGSLGGVVELDETYDLLSAPRVRQMERISDRSRLLVRVCCGVLGRR